MFVFKKRNIIGTLKVVEIYKQYYILKKLRVNLTHPSSVSLTQVKSRITPDNLPSLQDWEYDVVKKFISAIGDKLDRAKIWSPELHAGEAGSIDIKLISMLELMDYIKGVKNYLYYL